MDVSILCQHLQSLERDLMQEETSLPVFFSHETDELREIYEDLEHGAAGDQAESAWEGINSSFSTWLFPQSKLRCCT